ncbi:MAG TPA: hypothetical protein VJJ54_05830 [Gemmatimonadales bacterium]|nr:hypothetical protein [Gemmatimonadales bacterium]
MAHSLHQPHFRWARLRVDVNCGLRRGAWYPVVRFVKDRVLLDVTDDRVPVPRRLLETVFSRPFHWSIVPLPDDAINVPSDWGTRYVVCPACHARAQLSGHPMDMTCSKCSGVFQVAWDEHYLRRKR